MDATPRHPNPSYDSVQEISRLVAMLTEGQKADLLKVIQESRTEDHAWLSTRLQGLLEEWNQK